MSLLPVGISGEEAGYQIERSLRFNSADSAYLNWTPSGAGTSATIWTFSWWQKGVALNSATQVVFGAESGGTRDLIRWSGTGDLEFIKGSSTNVRVPTAKYRDLSAWYHFVINVSGTTVGVYVNGVQVTAFTTSNNPSGSWLIGQANLHRIGRDPSAGDYYNGYLTEIYFIDGQALTPSSFGETDTVTGVWKPKKYTGTYGTNGFYLNFSDNSGTTSTTLGKDSSGNGNNWTPNNFSVTAGAGNDSLVDTPTPYGTDTGVGGEVRGNYCTLNPLTSTNSITVSNGNLDTAASSASGNVIRSTLMNNTGKWYFEATLTKSSGSGNAAIGVVLDSQSIVTPNSLASVPAGMWLWRDDAYKINNGTGTAYGTAASSGEIIMIAYDADAGKIWFGRQGTWFASGDPSAGTNESFSGLTTSIGPCVNFQSNLGSPLFYLNFGQRPFAYTAPSGFKALCTQNLPEPTIVDGSQYFNSVLWTGTGSGTTRAITGVGFQPDWVWAKARSQAYSHGLYDVIRGGGANSELQSDSTAAEGGGNNDEYGYLSSFDSDGFTSTAGTQGAANNLYFNQSGTTYVAWNWKANGSGVSNTDGTITSTVSANTDSGFSIVTYTGNGSANQTVGHGLGVAPAFGILKDRDTNSNNNQWQIFHTGAGDKYGYFTTAAFAGTAEFYPTSGSSTTVTIARGSPAATTNESGDNYVMYLFAAIPGYSAFGSYTGNGSTDGPFVFTNHRPAFILIKQSSASGENWEMFDSVRGSYNSYTPLLYPNGSNAELYPSPARFDILSNGFKIRSSNAGVNASGATYIYMAFAESPFKFALAR